MALDKIIESEQENSLQSNMEQKNSKVHEHMVEMVKKIARGTAKLEKAKVETPKLACKPAKGYRTKNVKNSVTGAKVQVPKAEIGTTKVQNEVSSKDEPNKEKQSNEEFQKQLQDGLKRISMLQTQLATKDKQLQTQAGETKKIIEKATLDKSQAVRKVTDALKAEGEKNAVLRCAAVKRENELRAEMNSALRAKKEVHNKETSRLEKEKSKLQRQLNGLKKERERERERENVKKDMEIPQKLDDMSVEVIEKAENQTTKPSPTIFHWLLRLLQENPAMASVIFLTFVVAIFTITRPFKTKIT